MASTTSFPADIVPQAPEDALFGLARAYRADNSPLKVDLVCLRDFPLTLCYLEIVPMPIAMLIASAVTVTRQLPRCKHGCDVGGNQPTNRPTLY